MRYEGLLAPKKSYNMRWFFISNLRSVVLILQFYDDSLGGMTVKYIIGNP